VELTIIVNYGPDVGDVTLTNQIGVRPDTVQNAKFAAAGDSGSVVVNAAGDVLGLHCAGNPDGYGVSNPIDAVLEALDVTLCTAASPPPPPPPPDPGQAVELTRPRAPTLSPYPPPWPPRPPQVPHVLPYPPLLGPPRGSWGACRTWED
jgi:hypothetical protein